MDRDLPLPYYGMTRRTMLTLAGIAAVGAPAAAGRRKATDDTGMAVGYGGVGLALASTLASDTTTGLVGRWPLDGTGPTATDAAGGNDGAVRGSPTQGVDGVFDTTAYAFGTSPDNYVEVADASALRPGALSVGGWYRTDSGANSQTVVQKADSRYGREGYAVDVQTPNSLRGHVAVESGQAAVNPFGLTTQDGAWHHVFMTWDGSDLVLYFDGDEVDRDSSQSGDVVHSGRPLYIGWGDNSYTTYYDMDGALDDIRLYDTGLSATQVTDIFENNTGTGDPAPLPNDEFGEAGFGAHGFGGAATS